jgi:hypothetical protein
MTPILIFNITSVFQYFNDVPFYIGFSILYILIMIAINVEFYFNTVWSFDCGMFGRVTNTYRHVFTNCPRGLMPTYKVCSTAVLLRYSMQ